MTTFSIPDSTTTVELDRHATPSENARTGTISFTVRNTSEDKKTARLQIEEDPDATPGERPDLEWFSIDGAADTNRQFMESDFAEESSQTIGVSIKAVGKDDDHSYKFRLRATAEDDPDNDFVVGPWVTVAVPHFKVPVPPPPPRKWWKIVVGVVLAIVASLVLWRVLFDHRTPPPVLGLSEAQALATLQNADYKKSEIQVRVADEAQGQKPRHALGVEEIKDETFVLVLTLDPGITVPKNLVNATLLTASQRLLSKGLIPEHKPRIVADEDPNVMNVTSATPESEQPVAKGATVTLTYNIHRARFRHGEFEAVQGGAGQQVNAGIGGATPGGQAFMIEGLQVHLTAAQLQAQQEAARVQAEADERQAILDAQIIAVQELVEANRITVLDATN